VFALKRSQVVCEVVRPDMAVERIIPVLGSDPQGEEEIGEGER